MSEIVIRIGYNYQEMGEIAIRIIDSYQEKNEIVRLGNGIVTLGNVYGIDQGQPYERLYKINKNLTKDYKKPPIYQFL